VICLQFAIFHFDSDLADYHELICAIFCNLLQILSRYLKVLFPGYSMFVHVIQNHIFYPGLSLI
jgi:hypothetical protein